MVATKLVVHNVVKLDLRVSQLMNHCYTLSIYADTKDDAGNEGQTEITFFGDNPLSFESDADNIAYEEDTQEANHPAHPDDK